MKGKLYLVGTPIGNLSDITIRALETLKSVDMIACEDTRHTLALLNKYEIRKPLFSYYKQKEREGTEKIIELLDDGKNIALVTDAGMPCISDPGSFLVKTLLKNNYNYTVIPGASAVICASSLVGTENGFTFIGFLPEKNKEKDTIIEKIKILPHTVFFYSAPHDINNILEYLYKKLGDRVVYIIKEISKIYENIIEGTLKETRIENPKGEYVIGVEPIEEKDKDYTYKEIKEEIIKLTTQGKDKKTAVKEIAEKLRISKNIVYKISIEI